MAAEAAAVETKEVVAADVAAVASVETGEGAESASGSVSLCKGGTTLTFTMTGTATVGVITKFEAATETVIVEMTSEELDVGVIIVEPTTLDILIFA